MRFIAKLLLIAHRHKGYCALFAPCAEEVDFDDLDYVNFLVFLAFSFSSLSARKPVGLVAVFG